MDKVRLQIPAPPPFFDHPPKPLIPFEQWLRDFNRFIDMSKEVSGAISDRLKNGFLVAYLGIEGRRILGADPTFTTAEEGSHADFITKVKKLFGSAVTPFKAVFDFQHLRQQDNESVQEFLTRVRLSAQECNFDETFGDSVYDHRVAVQLTIGCKDPKTQEKSYSWRNPLSPK